MPAPTRPKRRWRVLAIAMAACAVLLAAAWAASLRWQIAYAESLPGRGLRAIASDGGSLGAFVDDKVRWDGPRCILRERADNSVLWMPILEVGTRTDWTVAIPFWIPTAASALAALAFWRKDAAHRRRLRTGLCPACGYDRVGLAGGAACPECGAAPATGAATTR